MPLLVVGAVVVHTRPAIAWDTPIHQYHILEANLSGSLVNDNHIRIMSRSGNPPGPWQAPIITPGTMPYSVTAGWFWDPPATVVGNSLVIDFTGPIEEPGEFVWKNISITVPGGQAPWESVVFLQWTLNGEPVGEEFAVGFCTSSPVKIANPDVRPDGSPNASNMIVRNVQFAQSPQLIPNDQLTLEDPTAIALFAASLDPVRPGPFIAPPGTCLDITPDIDPSISAPEPGGQTVLVKGVVQSPGGDQYEFVAQFITPPATQIPVMTLPALIILAIVLIGVGTIFVYLERMRRGRRPAL